MLSSLGAKESKAPGIREPAIVSVSKERLAYFSAEGTESFVAFKYSKFLLCVSQIISCNQIEFLEEATDG